jgi:hypothetical protein
MALCAQVVDLVWLHLLDDAREVTGVRQITIVQMQFSVVGMGVLVNVVNTVCIEQRCTAFDAVNDVTFF